MTDQSRLSYPKLIANYLVGQKLGAGFSGAIFIARNIHTNHEVALKLQPINEPCPTNKYERAFYPVLQGGKGLPTLWAAGQEGPWDYLAIDLLGRSLDSIHRELMMKQDVWDLRSVCSIAVQVIDRLRTMHTRGILHRDIQLGNCVLGPAHKTQTIYMIDFGFSKFFIDPNTKRHIPDSKEPRDFIGNYWFSSVRVHCRNRVPSRRDDMEALALMLIHLLTPGGLSWTRNGVPKTDEAHDVLMREKRLARPEDLCRGLPPIFEEFLRDCRRLNFNQRPDYERWLEDFYELANEHGYEDIDRFIWPSPYPAPTYRVTAAPKPMARRDSGSSELEGVLNGIADMHLGGGFGDRQVLGERPNLVNRDSPAPAKDDAKGKGKGKPPAKADVIDLTTSSDEENANTRAGTAAGVRLTKAAHLAQLAREINAAADNRALAQLVRDFVLVMQENRSKMLTKEGFAVLDALHKQLGDPSVFVAPLRTTRVRASHGAGSQNENSSGAGAERETRQGKMNKLWRLAMDVRGAGSNAQLAKLVAEFGAVINRSSGRTVTKDGFGFLNGLAARIEALS
ncbi:CK1/CK1 protein kinase [Lentinus tigrinus ALCF2SS1-7]|uniref:CK1/CK1 protein kinase n=1 Tax=Lentinus tigrinus ALCF2SS1-6 TaxID=1328759 RepID=A0A5C2SEM2_9APHY|nr:CK1/CK1 protein kinase [Lentinus tigrinus ALCF2SS1-6]RPD77955.1 CK1/CK1 protein kinase [Lentinus tigrinus ALCF2SS1-7]